MNRLRHALVLSVLALTSMIASAAAPVDIRQGLVAYWPLESTPDGLTTPDLSPFGNHLNLLNMDANNFVPGHSGNAAQFNGTDELLSLIYTAGAGNGLPVSPSRRFTVAFWVNGLGVPQTDRRVFSEGSTAATAQLFNIGTDSVTANRTNVVDIFIRNDANTAVVSHRRSTNMVFDGTWHHVAWVQNDNVVRLYIDGVADPADFSYAATTFTFNTISLGGIQRATAGSYFAGLIDEAAVWERPLSQAEVQEMMNDGLTTPIPEFPPLIVSDPVSATIALGDNFSLQALAVGNRPLNYQWLKGGVEIPGATSPTYPVFGATAADNGVYSVRVSNVEGATTSAEATLTVLADPPADLKLGLVSYWPFDTVDDLTTTTPDLYSQNNMVLTLQNSFDLVPGNVGLSNALAFDATLTQYGRRVGGFPTYNSPTHSVSFWVKGNGAAQFDLRVFAEGSTNSNAPLFTFGTLPSPGGAGMRVFIRNDANANILVAQTTRPVFDDAWHHVVWTDSNGTARVYVDGVQDQTNFRYTRGQLTLNTTSVGAILRALVGNYFTGSIDEVAVWNRQLSFTEVQQIYTGRIPPPTMVLPPEITKQPVGAEVFEGTDVTLSVEAIGTALEYQWRKNGADIPNATNSSLAFVPATAGNSGTYTVRVGNSAGSVVSNPAEVTVHVIENVTTGMVSYWPFDVVTGGTTPDTTPNANHLTLVNMDETNLVPGRRGNGLSFNGTDELAMRNHDAGSVGLPIYQHGAFTVALWVNGNGSGQPSTPNNGDRRVYSEGSTGNNAPLFNLGTDNANASSALDVFIRDNANGTSINHLKSAASAFDGNWHHVAYVDVNGAGRIYIDGALDSTTINYTRTPLTPNTTSIGGIVRAAQSHWFLGMIDDVAVWRRALSASEVTYVMNNGAVPPPELKIDSIEVTDQSVILTFTVPDPLAFHCIRSKDDLNTLNWTEVTTFTLVGPVGNTFRAEIPRSPGSQRFYQVYLCP